MGIKTGIWPQAWVWNFPGVNQCSSQNKGWLNENYMCLIVIFHGLQKAKVKADWVFPFLKPSPNKRLFWALQLPLCGHRPPGSYTQDRAFASFVWNCRSYSESLDIPFNPWSMNASEGDKSARNKIVRSFKLTSLQVHGRPPKQHHRHWWSTHYMFVLTIIHPTEQEPKGSHRLNK